MKNDLSDPVEQSVLSVWPVERWRYHRCCLAISGGADSTALLLAMSFIAKSHGLEKSLLVAHVNHGLRGSESDADAAFVESLSARLGIPCFCHTLDADELRRESKKEGSLESAARNLRYRVLAETAMQNGASWLLTAHTRDDQLETILQRLFRGTGLTGLVAIPRIRPLNAAVALVRPLLDCSRTEIVNYLNKKQQTWRTDSSNATSDYLRNRIRHSLVPILAELFAGKWEESLLRLSANAEELTDYWNSELDLVSDLVVPLPGGNGFRFCRKSLQSLPPLLLGEFLRKFWRDNKWSLGQIGRSQWKRMTEMILSGQNETAEFPGGIVIETETNTVCIISKGH